ncbi:Protein argonaute 18, partial [Zancudomyces culisetae]
MRYECGREFCSHASNNVSEDRSSNSKQAATNRVHESAGTAGRQAAKVLWKNKERDKRTSAATVVCAAEQQQRGVQPGETIRPSPQYCANVCLKINMKLGGLTSVVNAQETNLPRVCSAPTIVIGADVTHPGVQETNRPSIAAVV